MPAMDSPDRPLVNGHWKYPTYVSADNVKPNASAENVNVNHSDNTSNQKLIMPHAKRGSVLDTKNLGYRLRMRKELIGRRTRVSDLAFLLAIFGIVVVIIDTECQFAKAYVSTSTISVYLRVITSVTTIGLLVSIVLYHAIGIKLRLVSQGLNNCKLVTTWKDFLKLGTELLVCSIHPFPFSTSAELPMYISSVDDLHAFTVQGLPLNSMFTILMFMRIYLLMRFLVVHSALFCDTTVQSLGAMSNVNINAQFVFKALMTQMPGCCLITIMGIVLIVNSYSLRMCEYYTLEDHTDTFFMQAIWVTCVTFLTLGYGDVVPRTTCGRIFAIWTGMIGVGLMALSVAVLTRKLEQTRGEKYVHTFVQQIKMDKVYKNSAAKVVTEFLMLCRLRRTGVDPSDDRFIIHKRRLLHAVRKMSHARYLRTQVGESLIGPVEVNKNVNEVFDIIEALRDDQVDVKSRMRTMENMLTAMNEQLRDIKTLVSANRPLLTDSDANATRAHIEVTNSFSDS